MTEKELLETKIKNQEQQIENLKISIDRKKKRLEELKNKKWKPKRGEKYYYILSHSDIDNETYNGYNEVDRHSVLIGNYFKTEEEAEFEVERLRVLEELKEFSYEFSDNEWKTINTPKYYLYYDYSYKNNEIRISLNNWCKESCIYFKTKEDVERAIEKIGEDRLKKYYFKVGR